MMGGASPGLVVLGKQDELASSSSRFLFWLSLRNDGVEEAQTK